MTLADPAPVAPPPSPPATRTPRSGKQPQAEMVQWRDGWVDWLTGTRVVRVRGRRFTLTQRTPLVAEFRRDGALLGSLRRRRLASGESTYQIDWQAAPSRMSAEAVAALLSAPGPGIARTAAVGALCVAHWPLRLLGR